MTPEEFLAGVESRLTATDWPWGAAPEVRVPRRDLAKLTTALKGVLALHKPTRDRDNSIRWCQCDGAFWPCSTVRAITDALRDTP